jgi:hypothetical protein
MLSAPLKLVGDRSVHCKEAPEVAQVVLDIRRLGLDAVERHGKLDQTRNLFHQEACRLLGR